MSNNNVTIIVAAHKRYQMPKDSMYLPVFVGASGKEDIGFQRDDEGDNISYLNPFFCELTALFWGWKNIKSDYIGLVHYRRHFGTNSHCINKMDGIMRYKDIVADLKKKKVFVPRKRQYYIETLYSHYKHTHHIRHLDMTREIIREIYPEYLDSFDKAINRRWGYMFNMMIMKRELFDEYCCWLFNILFELWNRVGNEGLSEFQSRYCGRIGELIFNVWLTEQMEAGKVHKNEIKEIPVIYLENTGWLKKPCNFLKAKFFGKKYEKSI